MERTKQNLKSVYKHIYSFLKWIVTGAVIGMLAGYVGSAFHIVVDFVTEIREHNYWIIYLLPVGGIVIAFMYHFFRKCGRLDTNRVLDAVTGNEKVPFVMAPLIFISTAITHLLGGSAGREGAALQLGGSIGYNVAKVLRLDSSSVKIAVMSGMSGVFSALFGTPLTAAIFSVEVAVVGYMNYRALVPCLTSSLTAYLVANSFGLTGVHFEGIPTFGFGVYETFGVCILAVLCALVGILFCLSVRHTERYMSKAIPNRFLRGFIGGGIIVILTLLLNTTDYNGAGMQIIESAIGGGAKAEAFILKIIFTSITIAAGFKGGEIVPAFFIGSTFGCAIGALLGLEPSFCAAVGFVALFCSVVNCPIASFILSIEVFGADNAIVFAVVCVVSFIMSGRYSLYSSQSFVERR